MRRGRRGGGWEGNLLGLPATALPGATRGNLGSHVLTATVLDDPATGAPSLRVTAGLRDDRYTGQPTKAASADADAIMAACTDQTTAEGEGGRSG